MKIIFYVFILLFFSACSRIYLNGSDIDTVGDINTTITTEFVAEFSNPPQCDVIVYTASQNIIYNFEANIDDETPYPVNIYPLLHWQRFDDMQHIFGDIVYASDDPWFNTYYIFNNGIRVTVCENGWIWSIFADFSQMYDKTQFHFNTIDGESYYDDVILLLGSEPYGTRAGADEERYGAVISYGYWVGESVYTWIFFNEYNRVTAISYFPAVRRQY